MSEDKIKLQGIMSEGYGVIPKKVMKDKDLTIEAKAIYAFMASFSGNGNTSYPSVEYITDFLDISRHRFNRHRKLLEEKGYISVSQERKKGSKFTHNVYTLEFIPQVQFTTSEKRTSEKRTSENDTTNNNTINNNTINNNTDNIDHQPSDDGQSSSERFEVLWKEYPRKEGKKKAFASYKRALKNGVTDEEIMEGLEKYNQYIKKEKTDRKYIAHGSTWFNENRWQDEYDVNSNKGSNEKTWAGSDF